MTKTSITHTRQNNNHAEILAGFDDLAATAALAALVDICDGQGWDVGAVRFTAKHGAPSTGAACSLYLADGSQVGLTVRGGGAKEALIKMVRKLDAKAPRG
jgi:hypothetical protein